MEISNLEFKGYSILDYKPIYKVVNPNNGFANLRESYNRYGINFTDCNSNELDKGRGVNNLYHYDFKNISNFDAIGMAPFRTP